MMPKQAEERAFEIFQGGTIYLHRSEDSETIEGSHGNYISVFYTILINSHPFVDDDDKEDALCIFGDRHSSEKRDGRSEYIRDAVLFSLAISYTYQGHETFVDGKLFDPLKGI